MRVYRILWLILCAPLAMLGLTLGLTFGPMVLAVLVTSPYAVRTYVRWLLSFRTLSPAQLDKMVRALGYASPEYLTFQPPSGVDALTDEELCHSWRVSCTALGSQPSAAQTAATVTERQTLLDELERRNPRGFAAWLASEAWTPGNPLPYLTRGWTDQPVINWDELTRGPGR